MKDSLNEKFIEKVVVEKFSTKAFKLGRAYRIYWYGGNKCDPLEGVLVEMSADKLTFIVYDEHSNDIIKCAPLTFKSDDIHHMYIEDLYTKYELTGEE